MHTDEDFALLTYLLTMLRIHHHHHRNFYRGLSSTPPRGPLLSKLFTHVHRISMCIIVYIAKLLLLSPFDTWLSLHELKQNVLRTLHTYLVTHYTEQLKYCH